MRFFNSLRRADIDGIDQCTAGQANHIFASNCRRDSPHGNFSRLLIKLATLNGSHTLPRCCFRVPSILLIAVRHTNATTYLFLSNGRFTDNDRVCLKVQNISCFCRFLRGRMRAAV